MIRAPVLTLILLLGSQAAGAQQQTVNQAGNQAGNRPVYRENAQPARGVSIAYTLTIREPLSHLYDIDIAVDGLRDTTLDIAMPAWTPGDYVIRDYARNVQNVRAFSGGNSPLAMMQTDKQTWRIAKRPEDDVIVRYQVYSRELTDEMADLALPASIFMYVAGQKHVPLTVRYIIPPGWSAYTELEQRGDRFHATDYDVFIDAPALLGQPKTLTFTSDGGTPYRIVVSLPRLPMTDSQLTVDLTRIADAAAAMFGKAPYAGYTFFIKVQGPSPGSPGTGNLAHLNSSRAVVGENDFVNGTSYERFLMAAAQNLTRSWNGKRIRPQALTPIDYSREGYTRLLWMTEGISDYLADLLLVRSGILSRDAIYARMAALADAFERAPGRGMMSLEDASWNAWLRSDNLVNNTISYRTKGELVGALLDLEIRARANGLLGLEDVMKYLIETYADQGIGVPENGFLRALTLTTGVSFEEWNEKSVRGKGTLEYSGAFNPAGILATAARTPATLYVGVEVERVENNQARVRRVVPNSPSERAKLDAGDILVAIDSERLTFDNFTSRIHEQRIGRKVNLTVLRGERLLNLELEPAELQETSWSVFENPNATAAQIELRNAWLGGK